MKTEDELVNELIEEFFGGGKLMLESQRPLMQMMLKKAIKKTKEGGII